MTNQFVFLESIWDFCGWLYIVWKRPFQVGDRIRIYDQTGDVIEIHRSHITLLKAHDWLGVAAPERLIHLPCRKVFSSKFVNFRKGGTYAWHELSIEVTRNSNLSLAMDILQDIAKRHAVDFSNAAYQSDREAARHYSIEYEKFTPTVYAKVNAASVWLTLRYLVDICQRHNSDQAIWQDVLKAFDHEPAIEVFSPIYRLLS